MEAVTLGLGGKMEMWMWGAGVSLFLAQTLTLGSRERDGRARRSRGHPRGRELCETGQRGRQAQTSHRSGSLPPHPDGLHLSVCWGCSPCRSLLACLAFPSQDGCPMAVTSPTPHPNPHQQPLPARNDIFKRKNTCFSFASWSFSSSSSSQVRGCRRET